MRFSGKQVAAARELLGLTQEELAAAAGVSFRTISRFERGEVEPRRESLKKIEAELERRGIEFTNGDGIGVRLKFAKAEAYAKSIARDPRAGN